MTADLDLTGLSAFQHGELLIVPYVVSDMLHASSKRSQRILWGAVRDGIIVAHHRQWRNSNRAKMLSFYLCSRKLILRKWNASGPEEISPRTAL